MRRAIGRLLPSSGWLETLIALGPRMRFSRRRVLAIYRSLWTPAGRERLRIGAYARMPHIPWHLASVYRRTLARKTRVIAVVGSFGKTTTARAILTALGLPSSSHSGSNAGVALAVALLRIKPGDQHAVIEVGISAKGQMEGYARLIRPDIAVVTSIGSEHMTSLGTLDVTRAEKAKMVRALHASGLTVLNGDDPNVLWMRDSAPASVLTYGFGESNHVRASAVVQGALSGTRFKLHIDGEVHDVHTRLIGRHMIYPILAAVAVSRVEGREIGPILAALEGLEPAHNRLQVLQHPSGALLLLDAFKGALETIHAALDTLDELRAERKIVILGDVEEPPGSQGPIYKELGKRVAEVAVHVIFVGGKTNFDRFKAGTAEGGLPRSALTHIQRNPLEAAQAVQADLRSGDLVLVKGRMTQHLERIALILLGERVACATRTCRRHHSCATCPLLQRRI
ncbi:Mur ligase family protein [Candidatus Bipolaricaulota bacterium]